MHNVENFGDLHEEVQGWNVSLQHCWILQKKKKLWDAKKIFFFKEFKMNVSMQPF